MWTRMTVSVFYKVDRAMQMNRLLSLNENISYINPIVINKMYLLFVTNFSFKFR